ncbi:MAG: DUF4177 domain-containing protein [Gelidibacter sp.]
MKEYKVVNPAFGFRNKKQKLEDLLNLQAREGWLLKSVVDNGHGHISMVIFEREKNR